MENIIRKAVEGKYLDAHFVEKSEYVFWFFNTKEKLICAKSFSDILIDPEFWIALDRAGVFHPSYTSGEFISGTKDAPLFMWRKFIEHKFEGGTNINFFRSLININYVKKFGV